MPGFDAVRIAQEADKTANSAMSAIQTHEQVCAERYKNIHEKLEKNTDDVESIIRSLSGIQSTLSKGQGAYLLFSYSCMIIAAAAGIVEMYHYFH